MMQPTLVQKLRLVALALAIAASPDAALAQLPTRAQTHSPAAAGIVAERHHDLGGSLVRCTLLRQPGHAGAHPASRRVARLFAPTSQAVFFAHAGDRCMWRAGTAVRG